MIRRLFLGPAAILLGSLFLVPCTCVRAQNYALTPRLDSLRKLSVDAPNDSLRFARYWTFIKQARFKDSTRLANHLDTLESYVAGPYEDYFRGRHKLLVTRMLRDRGHSEQAREVTREVRRHFRAHGDSTLVALSFYEEAGLYFPSGEFGKALELLQRAYALQEAADDPAGELNTLNAMGMVQRRQGNLESAQVYYERAIELAEEHADRSTYLSILTNLGNVYSGRKNYAKADQIYLEAIARAGAPPANDRRLAYARTNLAGSYQAQGRLREAMSVMRKAYDYFEMKGSAREQSAVRDGLASIYEEYGDYPEAIRLARHGLSLTADQKQLKVNLHQRLAKLFNLAGQSDSAFYHLERSYAISSEINDEQQQARAEELEARFQTREKEVRIERMEAEELRTAQSLRLRGWIIGLAALGISLLAFLLYRNLKQRRRIEDQNHTISQALSDKELLIKEIHHRVKNNLQMVSSLLNLQTKYVADRAAIDALQLGRNRVRSMALIHQNLYLDDEVTALVDAKSYLERLVREVVDGHRPEETLVDVNVDIAPVKLDIDTLIPLGLITNEAVTNAAKYAFRGRATGKLEVSLWERATSLYLTVADDGPGLGARGNDVEANAGNPTSFGHMLMETLAEQLDGELRVEDTGEGVRVALVAGR